MLVLDRRFFDILLCVLVLLQPILQKLSGGFVLIKTIDEAILLYYCLVIFFRTSTQPSRIFLKWITSAFLLYSTFLVFRNDLPKANLIQVFLSSKYLIIFLYFNSASQDYKIRFFPIWINMLWGGWAFLCIGCLLEFVIPGVFTKVFNIYRDRGIGGFFFTSFYGSRILFSEFLVVLVIIVLCIKYEGVRQLTFWKKDWRVPVLFLLIFFIIFSFSRKELLFALSIGLLLLYKRVIFRDRYLFRFFAVIATGVVVWGLLTVFAAENTTAFSDKYVRFKIGYYAILIFVAYFPFGSGPGTYGSAMSLNYQDVYKDFNVDQAILGYGGKQGPIFDLFLFSIIAEYGMGALFVFYYYYKIFTLNVIKVIDTWINVKAVRFSLIFFCFVLSLMTPVLLNIIGFLIMTTLGLMLDSEND